MLPSLDDTEVSRCNVRNAKCRTFVLKVEFRNYLCLKLAQTLKKFLLLSYIPAVYEAATTSFSHVVARPLCHRRYVSP